MELSKKLYQLQKKQGLSQEQLAERLNVSRQAISKWESGTATPETDKLLAISNYFQVSLDYLMKNTSEPEEKEPASAHQSDDSNNLPTRNATVLPGIILSIGGILALCLWGLLSTLCPESSEQLGTSSMITIDGNGIFLLLCIATIICGAWLLLKDRFSK